LRESPADAKQDSGCRPDKVQKSHQPNDLKPMPSIGKGVEEIRVCNEPGIYRIIYTARIADAVYALPRVADLVCRRFRKPLLTPEK